MPVDGTTRRATLAHCESVRSGCRGSERTGQTYTGRSGAGPETLDGCVEGVAQVRQHVGLGEHLDRGAMAVPGDQAGVGVVAALARPVQIREQTGGVAGALQVGDHGVYLEGEWRTGARVAERSGREDPQNPRLRPAGDG